MEGYLLLLVTEVGDAAVSHQDSTIWDSPKQEGSLDVRQKKTKQKSTTVLNCLEENLPEIPDPHQGRERRRTVRSGKPRSKSTPQGFMEESQKKRKKLEAGH